MQFRIRLSDQRKITRYTLSECELQSRQCKSTKVSQIKLGQQVFTSSEDISQAFNNHFTSIGQTLAREIPTVDIDPLYYVKPSDRVFSFERINVQEVVTLVKGIDGGKATGLDNIPCKLLKIAADVVAPSLTCIFNQSLLTGIYPSDWKLAKVTPIFKNGSKCDLNNYRPISVIPAVAKIFEKIIYDQLYNYCCGASGASEQQHKQDLRRIYKRENEFSKSSLFTRMLCGFLPQCFAAFTRMHCAFYQSALRHEQHEVVTLLGWRLFFAWIAVETG